MSARITLDFTVADTAIIIAALAHCSHVREQARLIIEYFVQWDLALGFIDRTGFPVATLDTVRVELDAIVEKFPQFEFIVTKFRVILRKHSIPEYKAFVHGHRKMYKNATELLDKLIALHAKLEKSHLASVGIIKPAVIRKENAKYIGDFKALNQSINVFRMVRNGDRDPLLAESVLHNIDLLVTSNPKTSHARHKDFHPTASLLDLTQEESGDYIGPDAISLHAESRRYSCKIGPAAFGMAIRRFLEHPSLTVRVDIHSVVLVLNCPCLKIRGTVCGTVINLDDLLRRSMCSDEDRAETQRLFKIAKGRLVKHHFGVSLYTQCPKPDCPNGDGMIDRDVLIGIATGVSTTRNVPISQCNLCRTIWCTKCGKDHPGQLCAEENEEPLDHGMKRCPSCRIPTFRIDGCFHMTCPCGTHWCFDCNHFTPQANAYAHMCLIGDWQRQVLAAAAGGVVGGGVVGAAGAAGVAAGIAAVAAVVGGGAGGGGGHGAAFGLMGGAGGQAPPPGFEVDDRNLPQWEL
jgi:hypothetical protein